MILQIFFGFSLAWPFWALLFFFLQFFRNPRRCIPEEMNVVLSPADGRIIVIEKVTDPYLNNRKALKISIFMNIFNVHSQKFPVDGEVIGARYFSGKFLNAAIDKASEKNERNALIIKTSNGHYVSCVQIAGLIARRILCYASVGEHLKRGQQYGFIRFGSRLDVYLPDDSVPLVMLGEKVYAPSTILAKLPEEK